MALVAGGSRAWRTSACAPRACPRELRSRQSRLAAYYRSSGNGTGSAPCVRCRTTPTLGPCCRTPRPRRPCRRYVRDSTRCRPGPASRSSPLDSAPRACPRVPSEASRCARHPRHCRRKRPRGRTSSASCHHPHDCPCCRTPSASPSLSPCHRTRLRRFGRCTSRRRHRRCFAPAACRLRSSAQRARPLGFWETGLPARGREHGERGG